MLAPRRLNTPVPVLHSPQLQQSNVRTNNETIEKGREGLVGGDGRPSGQSEETLGGINGTAKSSERASSNAACTVVIQASPSASSRPQGDARVEIESLPGQNQIKPDLDDAKIENPSLPGINQDASNVDDVPKPPIPAAATNVPPTPGQPIITVNKPLPGQNQIMPSIAADPLALGSPPPGPPGLPGPPPPPPPPPPAAAAPPPTPPLPIMTTSSKSLPSSTLLAATNISGPLRTTSSSLTSAFSSSSFLTLSPVASFVTITRSEPGKENVPAAGISASTQSLLPANAAATTTPQAIAAAQSFSVLLSSTGAVAATTSTSAAVADNGSILHPTMRTLLIVFVILGVLSILVAVIVHIMVRSHKRRRAQQQSMRSQASHDASSDHIGVTTHISANSNDNPFLTASEKAIVNRAASSDGASELHDSSRFSDAVNSFVKKSRNLAYKISP